MYLPPCTHCTQACLRHQAGSRSGERRRCARQAHVQHAAGEAARSSWCHMHVTCNCIAAFGKASCIACGCLQKVVALRMPLLQAVWYLSSACTCWQFVMRIRLTLHSVFTKDTAVPLFWGCAAVLQVLSMIFCTKPAIAQNFYAGGSVKRSFCMMCLWPRPNP